MNSKNSSRYFLLRLLVLLIFPLASNAQTTKQTDAKLVYGKYGCTASRYRGGQVEYTPKGSFVLAANGTYTYYGFQQPSTGKFTVGKDGNLLFTGGYFNGGKAEKIDRPNKFFLTFPGIPDNRWTCGLVK
jgi:hypothetical protein